MNVLTDENGNGMTYRREIDGLRAIAILPVIFFHAGFEIFSGGYVGVDVFFVISGYLITSLLITQFQQARFSIARFYERRARRILPALFLVMMVCLPFSYLWMMPSQLRDFSASLVSVVFAISNLYFMSQVSYFSSNAELQPLLHTWSLGVEEQYYVIFPLVLYLLRNMSLRKQFGAILGLVLISFGFACWGAEQDSARNFFFSFSRFWEIGTGSICAYVALLYLPRSSNFLGLLGLLMILFSIFIFDSGYAFPGVFGLFPVIGSALIILFAQSGSWVAVALSLRPMVAVGLVSYSAYLWHQPLFAFARLRSLQAPAPALMFGMAILAFILASVSWYFVERPFRRTRPQLISRRKLVLVSFGFAGAFVALGLVGYLGNGLELRSNGTVTFSELDKRISANPGLGWECTGGLSNSPVCIHGSNPKTLLWGDSFAMHLAPGLTAGGFIQQTLSQCAPILDIAQLDGWMNGLSAQKCMDFNTAVMDYIGTHHIDMVILSSPFFAILDGRITTKDKSVLPGNSMSTVTDGLLRTVDMIRARGAKVVIVSPTPNSGHDNGQCLVRSQYFKADTKSCDFPLNIDTPAFELLRGVQDRIPIYWLYHDFCDATTCDVLQDGNFIFRDSGHLSIEGSRYLGRTRNWMVAFGQMAR